MNPLAQGTYPLVTEAAPVPCSLQKMTAWTWLVTNIFLAFALALAYHVLPATSALDVSAYTLSLASLLIHCRFYGLWFRPTFWFLLIYVALFFINPLVTAIVDLVAGGASPTFQPEVVATYHVITLSGAHLFLAGQTLTAASSRRSPAPRLFAHFMGKPQRAVYFFFVLQLVACLLFVVDQGGAKALLTLSRVSLQLGRSALSLAGIYLVYFSMPLFFLLPAFWKGRPGRLFIGVSLALLVNVVAFLAFRIRTVFLSTLVAMVSGWVFTGEISFLRRPWPFSLSARRRKMLLAAVLLLSIALLGVTARFLRGQLEGESTASIGVKDLGTFLYLSVQTGDFGYSPTVMTLISMVPSDQNYLWGQSYWRLLLVAVPRSLNPDKPPSTERLVASWLMPEMEGLTVPPGINGDLYINFGLWGVTGMALWGVFFRRLDAIGGLRGVAFSAASFPGIFHLTRGSFTNSLLILATAYIGSAVLEKLLNNRALVGSTRVLHLLKCKPT